MSEDKVSPYSPHTRRPWEWYEAERNQLLNHLLGENWEQRLEETLKRMEEENE